MNAIQTRETVHLVTWRLLDYDGAQPTFGGVQRWVVELAALLRGRGHPVVVHQRGNRDFERTIDGGVVVRGWRAAARAFATPWFNYRVHRAIPAGAPVVYLAEDVAQPICRRRSVVVQHGIWWDGEYGWWKARIAEQTAFAAVRRTAATICVDTNFINWFRACWPRAGFDAKLHFVPNFVDPDQFGPQPAIPAAAFEDDGRTTICFPRRSEPRRGIWLMADVAPRLAARHPNVDFRFVVGSGYHTEQLRSRLAASGIADRRWTTEVLPFERMREAYERSAITVVPTICGEGTSLSVIEAMYFGSAVVATWVGGLANLVQDGENGLLVAPLAQPLEAALGRLIADRDLRVRLGTTAMRSVVGCYGVQRWRDAIAPILCDALRLDTTEAARRA
jgi:glycosyltransferase involved in cell wall biosynthesis